MKKVFLLFFVLFLIFDLAAESQKIALIIAIGDYPEEYGWRKINSVNDIHIIKSALINQGFPAEEIRVLKDKDATRDGILAAIDELYNRTELGSIVYFHYSGHGQQIIDEVGDEIDGLDESLVPYNAGIRYDLCPAKGNNHIRDDLLGVLLNRIRKKIGPEGDLIVVLDACHSGTATRNIGVSRGTSIIFGPPGQEPNGRTTSGFSKAFFGNEPEQSMSPMVVVSASSATELNFEYSVDNTNYGSLSYALSRAMHQMGPDFTYRALFGKVQTMMSSMVPRQNPQLEGSVDRGVFAGNAVEQKNFTTVKLWRNNESVLLNAGRLNGFNNNTIVEFYPIGSTNPHQPAAISSGKVVNAQLTEALVILDKPLTKEEAEKSWVFIKEMSFGNERLIVQLSENISQRLRLRIQNKFQGSNFLSFGNDNPDLFVDVDNSSKPVFFIITRNDQTIFSEDYSTSDFNALADKAYKQIQLFAQAQLLRSLEAENTRLKVTFELIPVKLNQNFSEVGRVPRSSKTNRSGQLVFQGGDFFKIRITNQGNRAAYYSLIDIQPDNVVNILIPEKDQYGNPFRAPSDCKIEPGKSEEMGAIFYISDPYGQEVFKLVSSSRPLHLDQILRTSGQVANRNLLHPFEAIFADSFDLVTRDAGAHRLPPEQIHIHTVVFEIAPIVP